VDNSLAAFQFHRALQEIWLVIDRANRYIESSAPWSLAKDPAQRVRLDDVLYVLAETLRHVARLISPFMPGTSLAIAESLGISKTQDCGPVAWGYLTKGQQISKPPALFPRRTPVSDTPPPAAPVAGSTTQAAEPVASPTPQISIEDFAKVELRVGKILAAERVPKSSKLLKLQVDLGTETRQIVAGIGTKYEPDVLIGRLVAVVANLKPAKLMGVESQGMILAAGDKEVTALLGYVEQVQPGMRIK
jgi:methionyl-tRNA synthetase